MGNYIYFGTSPMGLRNGIDWFAIPLCGAVGVLAGGLFSRVVVAMARIFQSDGTREQALPARLCCDLRISRPRSAALRRTGRSTVPVIRRSKRRLKADRSCLRALVS